MEPKIYYIDINDEATGMGAISLVGSPAVGYEFLKFNEVLQSRLRDCVNEEKKVSLHFNADQRIITGVVCLADTPIYRYTEGIGPWYCVFTKDVIKKMIVKYSKDTSWNRINLQHEGEFIDGVYMIESYIKDSNRGIVPAEFADIPDGSWLVSFYVENEQLWDEIKNSGMLNGFSLEGFFNLVEAPQETKMSDEKKELNIDNVITEDELMGLLKSIFD